MRAGGRRPGPREPLRRGHRAGPVTQVLGAEQFSANRTGEQLLAAVVAALEESRKKSEWSGGCDVEDLECGPRGR